MAVNFFSVAYAAGLASIEQGSFPLTWYAEVFWNALGPELPLLRTAWAIAAICATAGIALTLLAPHAGATDGERDEDRARATYVAVTAVTALIGYAAYVGFISVRTQIWYYLSLMSAVAFACDRRRDRVDVGHAHLHLGGDADDEHAGAECCCGGAHGVAAREAPREQLAADVARERDG